VTSVVIAAHNEAAVIGSLLTALTNNREPYDFDIVVVCNGCTDGTADVARSFGSRVRVIETAIANKPHALNLGDEFAQGFPRVYIDADIIVDGDTVMALAGALQSGEFLAAGVSPQIDTSGCTAGVKAYYAIKDQLPSSREGIAGSGLYALSEAGRGRFGKFPAIVSEDLFIRLLFKESERTTLPGLHSVVFAAKNVKALLVQRTRSSFGNGQIARLYPHLLESNAKSNNKALLALFRKPRLLLKLPMYLYVTFKARWAARRLLREAAYTWEREETSRMNREPMMNGQRTSA
jgi:glycosyltransferase involved in cell wall biosynthesis